MKMKIILIAIIASCYAAPGYEKSENGLIPQVKNDYKLLPQLQAKNDYKGPPQPQWYFGMKLEKNVQHLISTIHR